MCVRADSAMVPGCMCVCRGNASREGNFNRSKHRMCRWQEFEAGEDLTKLKQLLSLLLCCSRMERDGCVRGGFLWWKNRAPSNWFFLSCFDGAKGNEMFVE